MDHSSLDRLLDRPCTTYTCADADELAACVAELRDAPDSWQTMFEAELAWNGRSVPYVVVVHDDTLTAVFGDSAVAELAEEERDALTDTALQYFAIKLSGAENPHGH